MQNEKQLLTEAVTEIRMLRKENELMRARLEMFDAINKILHTQPASISQGMSPNLVWTIEKFLASQSSAESK